jgi:hypothetical protein
MLRVPQWCHNCAGGVNRGTERSEEDGVRQRGAAHTQDNAGGPGRLRGARGVLESEGEAGEGLSDPAEAETRGMTSLSKVHLLSPCFRSPGKQGTPRRQEEPIGHT